MKMRRNNPHNLLGVAEYEEGFHMESAEDCFFYVMYKMYRNFSRGWFETDLLLVLLYPMKTWHSLEDRFIQKRLPSTYLIDWENLPGTQAQLLTLFKTLYLVYAPPMADEFDLTDFHRAFARLVECMDGQVK